MEKKKIDWTHHLIELVVVFVGITLAFTLNSWRDNYKNHQLEQKYLYSFFDEMTYNSTELDTIIRANEEKLKYVSQFMNLLTRSNLQNDSALVILGDMHKVVQFTPKLSTYQSIKNSGNLTIISNYHLKEDLIKYYQGFEEKKLREAVYNSYLNEYIIPFAYEHMDFLSQKIINTHAVTSHKFRNLVVGYYQLLKQNIDYYKIIYETGEDLKLQLNSELQ